MERDIFGDSFVDKRKKYGIKAEKIISVCLGILSALAGLFIIFKFQMVTALIGLFVAEVLTTAIPTVVVIVIFIYLWIKLKWRTMRMWW